MLAQVASNVFVEAGSVVKGEAVTALEAGADVDEEEL